MNEKQILEALEKLKITQNSRWDNNSTAIVAQRLRHVDKTLYKKRYPALKGSHFVPFDTSIGKGAEEYEYIMMDSVGVAQFLTNYVNDLEDVSISVSNHISPIEGVGLKYSWTIQDIHKAVFSGVPLKTEKALAVRTAIAEKIDDSATRGAPEIGLYGVTNHPSVSLFTPATGSWLNANGTVAKTGIQMQDDVRLGVNGVNKQSRKSMKVNTVALPPDHFQALQQTRVDSTAVNSTTVLASLRGMFPGVTFEEWDELENADVDGTGARILIYHKSKEVLALPVPILFEQLPPQAVGLRFEVNCHGRVGSLVVRYSMAMGYMDGC